ncbi:MAG TPA: DMT family transporter [Gemmatimonadaceae bacterium]|nr:DMT family transporter [Gemmatimonadaceae bacterium]
MTPEHHGPPAAAILALALLGISVAAPLVRLSDADPLAIAAWRLFFSLIIIAGFLIASGGWRQWRSLDTRGVALAIVAGVLLALHFWSWNASVELTTVAASVVLVNLQPVVVAVLSTIWLKESPNRRQWLGIAIAMVGALVVAGNDLGDVARITGNRALLGDLLALGAGVAAAIYYLAGRRLRQSLDIWPYVGLVYAACFVTLVGFAVLRDVPLLPQPPRELAIFAALAVGPMMLGHTGMNWALRYLPAYVVNLTVLGEPVGATLLAAILPGIHEVPPILTLVGGALVLTGIVLALPRFSS